MSRKLQVDNDTIYTHTSTYVCTFMFELECNLRIVVPLIARPDIVDIRLWD